MDYLDERLAESEASMRRWTLSVGALAIVAVSIVAEVF